MAKRKPIICWGVLWREKNKLDGVTKYLMCAGCVPVLFVTRDEARDWINEHYGYIRTRADLRREPHGWRMPKPVRVKISEV